MLVASIATENWAIIDFAGLAIAFVLLTSPTASHVIARAAQRRDEPGEGREP